MKESLLRYLERERLAEHRANRELRALPVADRVECGEAIADLTLVSRGGGTALLRAPDHNAKFREGDILWLGDGVNVEAGLAVRLVKYDSARAELLVEQDSRDDNRAWPSGPGLVLDRRSIDLGDRFESAIHEIFGNAASPILRCLEGTLATDDVEADRRAQYARAKANGLDKSQAEAFARALARPRLHLIQGPPGTGKTRLLAEILDACAARGERVAVVAYTHRAVNQVLLRAAERSLGVPIVKVESARLESDELTGARIRRVTSLDKVSVDRAPFIVGMTTHAACRAKLKVQFDRVVFDEAGQIPLPHGVASMRLADRWILAGDHAQLPPVVAGEHADEHRVSLFEHLAGLYPSTMLETTYRMNGGVCAFPSKEFYGGRLHPSPEAAARSLALRPGGRFRAALDPAAAAVWVEVPHVGATMVSRREANLTAALVAEILFHHRIPAEEVAVVAPFRAQGAAIRTALAARAARAEARTVKGAAALPFVETVERIQGREHDVVFLSLTSSDPDWLLAQSDFYFMPNRLNVALTRARVKCIVLASPAVFEVRPRTWAEAAPIARFHRLREALVRVDGTALEREAG